MILIQENIEAIHSMSGLPLKVDQCFGLENILIPISLLSVVIHVSMIQDGFIYGIT
jgi:hypothetical protein